MTSGILDFKPLGEPLPVVEVMSKVVSFIEVEVVSVPIRRIKCNISSIIVVHLQLSKGNCLKKNSRGPL